VSDAPGVLNIREAAGFLGVHEQTVRKLARRGAVPCFKVGRDWRFRREALLRWSEEQQPQGGAIYVLAVDDDENICRMLARILSRSGHRVVTATSGQRGLELVAQETPDVLLLDLVMPDMNGPRFLEHLRRTHPSLPVVIVTGHPDSQLMTQAARFAPVMLLAKPVEPELLERTVRTAAGRGAARPAGRA
jgi:excisionase family DNA binding protein